MPFRYRAFGLLIESEVALGPGAPPSGDAGVADVHVRLARGEPVSVAQRQVTWDGCCRLSLLSGGVLILEPSTAATPQDLALAASGTGLALALEQRSVLVLHGSCVAIDGRAVCLLGNSGAGKSTLAAALHVAGHALISDAMTAITLDHDGLPWALPGWPVFKLWPNTVDRLGLQAQGAVHTESHKLLCAPSGICTSAPIPVRWFVGVAAGEPPELVRLSPSAGVMTLLRNHYLLDDTAPSEHPGLLRRAGQAVAHAGVASLTRGVDLKQLDEVVARIEGLARSAPQV